MQLLTIIAMLFTIGGVMFALQNNMPVTVNFLFWRFDSSLALVLMIALALGGMIVALASTPATLRRQWQIARQRRKIEQLEKACRAQTDSLAGEERPDRLERLPTPGSEPPGYVGMRQIITGTPGGSASTDAGPRPPDADT